MVLDEFYIDDLTNLFCLFLNHVINQGLLNLIQMSINEQRIRVESEISSLVDNLDREVLRKMQVEIESRF